MPGPWCTEGRFISRVRFEVWAPSSQPKAPLTLKNYNSNIRILTAVLVTAGYVRIGDVRRRAAKPVTCLNFTVPMGITK